MPFLLAIGGHTGTGKSTLAHALRGACHVLSEALIIDMDQARREMLGYDLKTMMKPEDYADEVTVRVRAFMDGLIESALREGRNVIDASGFFSEEGRGAIESLAVRCGVPFVGLWLLVSRKEQERRILARRAERIGGLTPLALAKGHASDADLGVIAKFGDLDLPQSKAWVSLDADGTADEVLHKVLLFIPPIPPEPRPAAIPVHTDIQTNDWLDRFLPAGVRPYARLMRLDRPIGTWLLFWPCVWGMLLAASGSWPSLWSLSLFAVGAVIMRGAGCALNDLYDREIDRKVERTLTRPLASGALSVRQALVFLAGLLSIGLVILLQFNALTIGIGCASLVIVAVYPLAKRVTYWPQLVLGLAFNWGALLGWTAVRAELGVAPILLYAAGIFWTLGYDTIYAHQDKKDDVLAGVKSLALYLGPHSRFAIGGFYGACLVLLALAGASAGLGLAFYGALLLPAGQAIWQLRTWQPDDPANCLIRFRSNRDFGFWVAVALGIGQIL